MTRSIDVLLDGIRICDEVLRGERLPHQVDIWDLWERVKEASVMPDDIDQMRLYASLARKVVSVLRLQCSWLRYEADELFVGSDIARDTIEKMHLRSIITIFIKSLHPVVEVEQLNTKAVEMGMDHWEELIRFLPIEDMAPGRVEMYRPGSEEASHFVGGPDFEGLVSRIEDEYRDLSSQGKVEYWAFLSRDGTASFAEVVERAFLTSFLLSQGRLSLRDRDGRLLLSKPNDSQRQISQSLAVVIRSKTGGR